MKLIINDSMAISGIQKKFQDQFPFLRLEFFHGVKENSNPNPLERILDETKKLEDIRPVHHAGELEISGEDKVSAIENLFRDRFGLHVEVSRKSGNKWLVTNKTDEFTLNHQNDLGGEMAIAVEQPEPEDIHEQE